MRDLIIFVLLFVSLIISVLWWWSGPSSNELVTYAATCTNNFRILPVHFAQLSAGDLQENLKRHREARENCKILDANTTTYKINEVQAEVYYQVYDGGTARLVDCAIFNTTDWTCSYPDGSGKVVIIDGLPATKFETSNQLSSGIFYLRRWQWWATKSYWWINDEAPQGAWLIPEQKAYF